VVADVVEPAREGMDDPDRAAVRDHQHGLVRVPFEHVPEEGGDPRTKGVERLGIVGTRPFARQPPPVRLREGGFDLGGGHALPGAEGALAQARIEADRQAELTCQDLRRLLRARQVARVDDVDVTQLTRKATRLLAPEVVQVRVGMALPASVAVPVGLAVAYEQKGRQETD